MTQMICPVPSLGLDDPRWKCKSIVEVSSASFDLTRVGIGSSPFDGDASMTGVQVPTAPTTKYRYLLRLAGIDIPSRSAVALYGMRQLATIRSFITSTTDCPPAAPTACVIPIEQEILNPFWSFTNGNISWHLRFRPIGLQDLDLGLDAAVIPSSLSPVDDYSPPGAGIPPGQAVGAFGTWRDLRFPWQTGSVSNLHTIIPGPGSLVMYASVLQTDPCARCVYPSGATLFNVEDLFVQAYPDAKYGRVAGSLIVGTIPEFCPEGVTPG